MKVLFDQGTPALFGGLPAEVHCRHACRERLVGPEQRGIARPSGTRGLRGVRHDRSEPSHQQNLAGRQIGILVLLTTARPMSASAPGRSPRPSSWSARARSGKSPFEFREMAADTLARGLERLICATLAGHSCEPSPADAVAETQRADGHIGLSSGRGSGRDGDCDFLDLRQLATLRQTARHWFGTGKQGSQEKSQRRWPRKRRWMWSGPSASARSRSCPIRRGWEATANTAGFLANDSYWAST